MITQHTHHWDVHKNLYSSQAVFVLSSVGDEDTQVEGWSVSSIISLSLFGRRKRII